MQEYVVIVQRVITIKASTPREAKAVAYNLFPDGKVLEVRGSDGIAYFSDTETELND